MKALDTLQSMAVSIFFMGVTATSLTLSVASYFVKDGSGWMVAMNIVVLLMTGLGSVACYLAMRSHLKLDSAPAATPDTEKQDGTAVSG